MDTRTITATDIMTSRLAVTSPEAHVIDAIDQLITKGVSGLPVVNRKYELLGRFSERSAIAALDLSSLVAGSHVLKRMQKVTAGDLMDRLSLTFNSNDDVFSCSRKLLRHRASGAPVVDDNNQLTGVFSEQSVMHVFVGLCWEQLPSSSVTAWLDRQDERRIAEDTTLDEILNRFQNHAFRRLMVLRDGRLLGQVTRRDALKAAINISSEPLVTSHSVAGEQQMGLRTDVGGWMYKSVPQTTGTADVLSIANLFLRTAARQLPVVEGARLDGQVSRSDLLRAVERYFPDGNGITPPSPLYLSSLERGSTASMS